MPFQRPVCAICLCPKKVPFDAPLNRIASQRRAFVEQFQDFASPAASPGLGGMLNIRRVLMLAFKTLRNGRRQFGRGDLTRRLRPVDNKSPDQAGNH
jgi:hypothetical protein